VNVCRPVPCNRRQEPEPSGGAPPPGPSGDAILLEGGDYLLLEDDSYLLLE
jgi:hypothetical protein